MPEISRPTQEELDRVRREVYGDEAQKLSDETVIWLLCNEFDD